MVAVGRVGPPRGVLGEVLVEPLTDFPERFGDLHEVLLQRPDGSQVSLDVSAYRCRNRRVSVVFEGIATPEAAKALRGSVLLVPRDAVHPLPDDTYYVFDIVGLRAEAADGTLLGKVVDVLSMPANDVYVIDHEGTEAMIPAVREHVTVDIEAGRIVVHNLEAVLPHRERRAGPGGLTAGS